MQSTSNGSQILLAIQAIKNDASLSIRAAAKIYSIHYTTLGQRLKGRPSRRDTIANSRKLTDLEEESLIRHILDLDSRGFPPRMSSVEEMANLLLANCSAGKVGKNWTSTFVKRHQEVKTKYSRKYDYQRALYENPALIRSWFTLVQNTIAKYGIMQEDINNFDKTGFLIGVIAPGMVVASSGNNGRAKLAQ
ncbi:hypothetical protein V491_00863 [Pseudogymnoascus sp. VKM F-3775]|nr:hypothetical protein V491_00863 [Pseudogymnoascus sp. VKM F-3775]